MTRYVLRSAAAAVVAALALTACGESNVGVAARVGDREISAETVADRVDESVRAGVIPENGRAALQGGWVAQMIKQTLRQEAARRLGVLPPDAEMDRLIDEHIRAAGGQQVLERQLAQENVAPKFVRSVVENIVLYDLIADELVKDVHKSEQELREAYQKRLHEFDLAEVAHINVAEKKLADDLVRRLRAGADFAQLAKDNSRDVQTAPQGGNLGVIGNNKGEIDKKIGEAIFSARAGAIVGPLAVPDGFEILKIISRTTTSFEAARERLRRDLLAADRDKRTEEYLRGLARELGVSVNPRFGRWDGSGLVDARDTLSTTQPTPAIVGPGDPVPPGDPAAPGGAPGGAPGAPGAAPGGAP